MSAPCPEYGFEIALHPTPAGRDDDGWRSAFVAAVEARGLSAAGGAGAVPRYVVTRDGGQAIDADREALRAWAAGRPEFEAVEVGPLVDLR